jgi:hypothetical protein
VLGLAFALRVLVALGIVVAIAFVGLTLLRAVSATRPDHKIEPEDVIDLDVFFVCGECGTEFQVTMLGEAQVPRHCGEPMSVERRRRTESEA